MKNRLFHRVICFILSVTLLCSAFGFGVSAASLKKDEGFTASTREEMEALVGTLSYDEYYDNNLSLVDPEKIPTETLEVGITDIASGNGEVVSDSVDCTTAMTNFPEDWVSFGDNAQSSVYLPTTGSTTWNITLTSEQAGLYYIEIEYFSLHLNDSVDYGKSSISSIERKLKINGNIPFDEVSTINLNKNWQYDNVTVVTTSAEGQPDSYNVKYVTDYVYDAENDRKAYAKIVTEVKDGVETVTTYLLTQDINGNSMAPEAVALPSWNTYFIQDSTGFYNEYFQFYFAGDMTHRITLEAEREPVIIKSIRLVPVAETSIEIQSYEDVVNGWKEAGYKPAADGEIVEIRAEFPDMVSDSSVAPTNDNTSPLNSPIAPNAQLYNVIGENSYSSVGQWAAYKFTVTEDGLYNLGMRFKQSALQGMFVCRTIKLAGGDKYKYGLEDGTPTAPFVEAYNTEFGYDDAWQSSFLGTRNVDTDERYDFMFYFEEGVEYTLYLECSLGTLKGYIQEVETILNTINSCYLTILQLTGTEPDEHTDYEFMKNMPEVVYSLLEESVHLMEIKEGLEKLCGTNGSHIATLETVAILLYTMGKDKGDKIPENMSTLKSYLGTLGTWINSSKSSSITVDSIWIVPMKGTAEAPVANTEALPEANANFFHAMWFEIQSFFCSFFVEYDQMGLTEIPDADTPTIDVWLATGRDQSQIWRTMIDAQGSYTDSTGTAVALKLVTASTLLPSILSGKGPDVYIGLGSADVINYAIRDAVVGISGNAPMKDGWTDAENSVFNTNYYTYEYSDGTRKTVTAPIEGDEQYLTFVSKTIDQLVAEGNFADAAMDTVTLLDVVYGVPQTMGFAMMFYRMDVLAELGQEVPHSWDDLLSILPVLQTNNMSIGVSYIAALDFMIYQKGGSMWKYTDESLYDSRYAGARIDLDSNIALEAFQFTCRLYTDYSFPVSYDAANRFRTGEMPIIIGDYASIYNQLIVYATEIEGLWEFCSLPGSERVNEDGTKVLNYDSLAGISATVILHGCDNLLAAWQFIQWQTGQDAQADYGNRMVALIGPSAKYETANLHAINDLSWTASEKEAIMNQMDHLSSIVNYPGSYIYTRYMQFAFLDVVNESADPIDALTGYIDAINAEITRKRQEFKDFDLWTPENDDDVPEQKIPTST